MSRVARWGVLALFLFGLFVATRPGVEGVPSIRAEGGDGLAAAYSYLLERGREVSAWEVPLGELVDPGTFILALPTVREVTPGDVLVLEGWVRKGGRVVVLSSGRHRSAGPPPALLAWLRSREAAVTGAPASWADWQGWAAGQMQLTGPAGVLAIGLPERYLVCPTHAVGRFFAADGEARVCTVTEGRGRLTLVNDASVWGNAQIASAGNLDLLEALTDGPGPVYFDEWHQGFGGVPMAGSLGPAPYALLAQGLLVYVALAWSLSRSVGPPVGKIGGAQSSMHRELGVLGALHAAGDHTRDAGERLLALARSRLPGAPLPIQFSGGDTQFVALARQVAQLELEARDG